ncbi:MAG TPA: DNA polymerase III subunit alpha [Elusimicrobia bacterium]|nr:DNA polymerase III subunit alpha [Elusimicrobiota bacterium]
MNADLDFVHLHNHTEYSLLDGMTRITGEKDSPSPLLLELSRQGAKGVAITDHGNMYGAIEFYLRCRKAGLKPIIGCEMYMSKGSRREKSGSQRDNRHITVLARDFEGYQNLMALSSKAFLEGFYYDARIDRELLAEHAQGLIVLSGCLKGELAQTLLNGDLPGAVRMAGEYRDILGPEGYYLEMMDHGIQAQKQVLKGLLEVHEKTGIPLVATNDNHYALKGDAAAHDAHICISMGKLLSDTSRLRFDSHEFFFKSPQEMAKVFHFAPEALKNTVRIAEACHLEIPMNKLHLPDFPVPEGQTQDSYLEKLCREGLERLGLGGREEYEKRLAYELGVIKRMGFSGYFLIVWDFIHYAKNNGVPVGPGRGSGAGSLVSYALDITMVDPIKYKLLFERFLNPDRKSMPDLDIDFSDTGREKVIDYVRGKYGVDRVASIVTFGSMKAKLVVRDVARVLGLPPQEGDRIAKLIPAGPKVTLAKALKETPQLSEACRAGEGKKLMDLAHRLEGLKRHTGVHAAGIVITKEVVWKYAPLSKGSSGVVTTQYDGAYLPMLGLLKMDFLGLRNLSVITDAVALVRARHDPSFDLMKIPMDDAKTYELLASGHALGVFQLDSEGIRGLLRRIKPTTFEDISAAIALYRPGPMEAGMLDLFVERKHGKKVRYDHPKLEPILQDTYGCIVYQEQAMEIAKSLAGFTPGEADTLRKAMSKKIAEEMEKQRGRFVDGCKKNSIDAKIATKIYDQIDKFGGYGFNKSHTVAYGLIAYQTAYLKANHPLEFFTALLTSEIGHSAVDVEGKENKLVTYLSDAGAMGIQVLGPDVQKSSPKFSIEGGASADIRFGLLAVKNVGHGAGEAIAAARGERPFVSLDDFCQRLDLHTVNRKTIESLIKAGAMDSLLPGKPIGTARAALMAALENTMDRQAGIKEDMSRGQALLFGADAVCAPPRRAVDGAALPETWHEHVLLQNEREVLGFYLSGHPLVRFKDVLSCAATHEIGSLSAQMTKPVRVAGLLASVKKIITRKGDPMARAMLEDLSGEIPLIIFPKTFAACSDLLKTNSILVVSGTLSAQNDFKGESDATTLELRAEELMPIQAALTRYAKRLVLHLSASGIEQDFLKELRIILRKYAGRIPVHFRLQTPAHGEVLVESEESVAFDERLFEELGRILGEKAWQIESGS